MLIFLWLLASMGVAYWAKLDGRNAFWWFTVAAICSPLLGSVALWACDRYGW